jgi:hypothetical protein
VFFISQHPLEILRKVLTNLTQFREAALDLVDPVIGLLFLMALLSQAESPGVAWLRAVVASSLGLFLAGSCLLQPDPLFLLAWEPLLAIIGAAHLSEWISERFPLIDLENGDLQAGGTFLDQPKISQWGRAGAYLVVVGLVIYPLFFFLAISRPGPAPLARGQVEPLKVLLPPQATVMTDQPALVAWYADRRAVWLCQRAEDWAGMERNVGPVDATYLTPAINQIDPEEQSDWWFWLASPEGIYRGLAPAKKRPPVGMLRVRRRDE